MKEYNIVPDVDNGIVCQSCQHPKALISKFWMGPGQGEGISNEQMENGKKFAYFCHICSASFISHHVTYIRLYSEQHNLFASLGYIANEIFQRLEKIEREIDFVYKYMYNSRR